MSNPVSISVTHNGCEFVGYIASIESTSLGYESHGILTAYLHLKWDGSGIGVGGFCLDEPAVRGDYSAKGPSGTTRVGTAYGLDHLIALMATVGAERWEKLTGSKVIVLFAGKSYLGTTAAGIAGIDNGRVLILKDHADAWKVRESA